MKISLNDFMKSYYFLYENDVDAIIGYITLNDEEDLYASKISELIAKKAEKMKAEKNKFSEWAYYSFLNLVPPIDENTPFPIVINSIRLMYLALNNNKDLYKQYLKSILEKSSFKADSISSLHPELIPEDLENK